MGTHACTRICNEKDYLELHTRWDGFEEEIKHDIENISKDWQNSISYMDSKINNDKINRSIFSWLNNLKLLLKEHKKNPNIENTSKLLCMSSFSHHHVYPNSISQDTLKYWGKNNPTVVAEIEKSKIKFSQHKDMKIEPKEIVNDYRVMRIYDEEDNNIFIDLKYKDISERKLFNKILTLPLFWRDFYTCFKCPEILKDSSDFVYSPIFKLMNKFVYFYSPTNKYTHEYKENKKDIAINTKKKKEKFFENVTQTIRRLGPFDMFVNSLATHIIFRLPVNVEPLTESEQLSDYKISFNVKINSRSRFSALTCNIPALSEQENQSLLNNISYKYIKQEKNFMKKNNLHENNHVFNFISLSNDNSYVGIIYEEMFQVLMESQRELEMKENFSNT